MICKHGSDVFMDEIHRKKAHVSGVAICLTVLAATFFAPALSAQNLPADSPLATPASDQPVLSMPPSGVWFRFTDPNGTSHINAHFNVEIYGIVTPQSAPNSVNATSTWPAFAALIYPNAGTRTLLRLGKIGSAVQNVEDVLAGATATQPGKNTTDPVYQTRRWVFEQERLGEAYHRARPEGFLVSSWLDFRGIKPQSQTMNWDFSVGAPGPDGRPATIRKDGAEFRSVNAALYNISRQMPSQAIAREFLRVFVLHIFLIETRVKDFGTTAMMNRKDSIPALSQGTINWEFQSRGLFGLGNSGVMFKFKDASEFPGVFASGEIFGGVYHMEGGMSCSVETPGGRVPVGSIECGKVNLKDGVADNGYFVVTLQGPNPDGSDKRSFQVEVAAAAQ